MNGDEAYTYAWEHAQRNDDGSRVEDSMVDLIEEHATFDADKAKRGHARQILARRKRPGQTAPDGCVVLPGMDAYGYEPHRVLADDKGNVTENQHAVTEFKTAEARRAQAAKRKAAARADREQNEADFFAMWTADHLAADRDPRELTWDTCVRETGLWKDADPDPDDAGPEDDE